jgi:dTDP-4-amino-4,6-dideoxy-D-glucose ammonia-lyase
VPRDEVSDALHRSGLASSGWFADTAATLVNAYIADPFVTLDSVFAAAGVDRVSFEQVLNAIRTAPAVRSLVTGGPTGKYWVNTILPLEASGKFDAVLANRSTTPFRVGLYPGPTCMFRCGFCARVTGERYSASAIDPGNEVLASLIDSHPNDDPFALYISGGLEPLTNPGTGKLVERAADRGFQIICYTNSFALSAQTLRRQPGLWRLNAIRTSLYGVDDVECEETTARPGALERVIANIRNLMRERARTGAATRVGFNYILLPGATSKLDRLIDLIAEINEVTPDRPVDFLTVRQDYSGRPAGLLGDEDRLRMQECLLAMQERIATCTPTLDVDFGYALEAAKAGLDATMLRIDVHEMRPTAHPQVAVQVDLLGDVYLYREAGFPGLPGAQRYIAGRMSAQMGLQEIVDRFVNERSAVIPRPGDQYFLDGFDQAVTARLRQIEADVASGWADARGFLR